MCELGMRNEEMDEKGASRLRLVPHTKIDMTGQSVIALATLAAGTSHAANDRPIAHRRTLTSFPEPGRPCQTAQTCLRRREGPGW